jgi:tetratricopeptide (TPR) repeat protein/transcriptional regulator with XRE-family HTH domain
MSQRNDIKKLWGRGLRELCERRGWKQKELADKAGVSIRQIQRVENGESAVSEGCYRRIAEVLGTTLEMLESAVSWWNVPRSRNPFFTGREEVIAQLRSWLSAGSVTLPQTPRPIGVERSEIPYHWSVAICGLGGVGKTQIAVEYAYRYRQDYRAVLWTQADSHDDLVSGFVAIANLLDLPQKNASDQKFVVAAVKGWLENTTGWLLIFDNADIPELLEPFMPCNPKGYILLTSRDQIFDRLNIRNVIQLDKMRPDEAIEFLFNCTGRSFPESMSEKPVKTTEVVTTETDIRSNDFSRSCPQNLQLKTTEVVTTEFEAAKQLAAELDYLPLALEQAAAYIKRLKCSFRDYLRSFRQRGLELLEKTQNAVQYPFSVATTWRLNFEQVEQKSAASAELLRMSAFLYPDRIPLELFTLGKTALSPALSKAFSGAEENPLILDEALELLMQYSLIARAPGSQTYSIHRLVQAVLKAGMDETAHRNWINYVVKALNCAFPPAEFQYWKLCEQLIPHVQTCAGHVEKWKVGCEEAVQLFNRAGLYLTQRMRLNEAEALTQQALTICEEVLPQNHPDTAQCLHYLGGLLAFRDRFDEAERMLRRALEIREKTLGPDHPDTAQSLGAVGNLFLLRRKCLNEAEQLLKQAYLIYENCFGTNHRNTVGTLEELGIIYFICMKFHEAEQCFRQVLTIRQHALGPEHPDTGQVFSFLGVLYHKQGKIVEAERNYERALVIQRKTLGEENPFTAMTAGNLAQVDHFQGKRAEADELYRYWLTTMEKSALATYPYLIEGLERYADLLRELGRDAEASDLEKRAREMHQP